MRNPDNPKSGIHPGVVTLSTNQWNLTYLPYTYHRGGMGREWENILQAQATTGNWHSNLMSWPQENARKKTHKPLQCNIMMRETAGQHYLKFNFA